MACEGVALCLTSRLVIYTQHVLLNARKSRFQLIKQQLILVSLGRGLCKGAGPHSSAAPPLLRRAPTCHTLWAG